MLELSPIEDPEPSDHSVIPIRDDLELLQATVTNETVTELIAAVKELIPGAEDGEGGTFMFRATAAVDETGGTWQLSSRRLFNAYGLEHVNETYETIRHLGIVSCSFYPRTDQGESGASFRLPSEYTEVDYSPEDSSYVVTRETTHVETVPVVADGSVEHTEIEYTQRVILDNAAVQALTTRVRLLAEQNTPMPIE